MKHLDANTLNLYLDDVLDTSARAQADAHLATCAECQKELSTLRALTATFDAWHAEPIPHDISAVVMTRLASRPAPAVSRWGAVVLGVQVVLVALFLVWLVPMAVRTLNGLPFDLTPAFDFGGLTNIVDTVPVIALPFPPVAPWILIAALVGGAVIWLVSNGLLLRRNRLLLESLNTSQEASQ